MVSRTLAYLPLALISASGEDRGEDNLITIPMAVTSESNDHSRDHSSDEVKEDICGHCQKVYDGDSETWLQCPPACRIWFHDHALKRKVRLWFS